MTKTKSTSAKTPTKRVSKAEWLQCALDVLQKEGIQGVRIERLARDLNVAKAGFYWHFPDRKELLSDMLNFWADEFTANVPRGVDSQTRSPRQRLLETMKMVVDHQLFKYDLSMRSWAAIDDTAMRAVRKVYKFRFNFVRSVFEDLGFRGTELEMRTQMFVCYYSLSPLMFPSGSRSKREALMKKQLNWFCR